MKPDYLKDFGFLGFGDAIIVGTGEFLMHLSTQGYAVAGAFSYLQQSLKTTLTVR